MRFYNGERALVINLYYLARWSNRVDRDASGLTSWHLRSGTWQRMFTPHRCLCDDYQLKRSESRSFTLRGMFPPELEAAARPWHRCTRSAGIRQLDGMDSDLNCSMLSVDDNTEFRSRCVYLCTLAWFLKKKKFKNVIKSTQNRNCARTPKRLGTVVLAHPDRVLSLWLCGGDSGWLRGGEFDRFFR